MKNKHKFDLHKAEPHPNLRQKFKHKINKLAKKFRFSKMKDSMLRNFLVSYLVYFRNVLTNPLSTGHVVLPEEPKDAFWTFQLIKKFLHIDDLLSLLEQGWNWFSALKPVAETINFLIKIYKWISPALPYIPFVCLGLSVCVAFKNFFDNDNKNFVATLKLLTDITGAILIGVGMGLIQWGTGAAVLYTGPALLIAASASVAAVGLVRACFHLYNAYHDPGNRKQHLMTAAKTFLGTFISTATCILIFCGMQTGQLIEEGFATSNWLLFNTAADLYKSTAGLSNAVLASVATLAAVDIIPKIYRKIQSFFQHWFQKPTKKQEMNGPIISSNEIEQTQNEIQLQIKELQLELSQKNIMRSMKEVCQKKLNVLEKASDTLKGEATHKELLQTITKAKKECPLPFGLYQSSFFEFKGKTQTLVEKALELSEPNISIELQSMVH